MTNADWLFRIAATIGTISLMYFTLRMLDDKAKHHRWADRLNNVFTMWAIVTGAVGLVARIWGL